MQTQYLSSRMKHTNYSEILRYKRIVDFAVLVDHRVKVKEKNERLVPGPC